MSGQMVEECPSDQLRVAFDLDAVLFSDESEVQYKSGGLSAFFSHERAHRNEPCNEVYPLYAPCDEVFIALYTVNVLIRH